MASQTFDDLYITSWDAAIATPGLFRNPSYNTTTQRRRLPGSAGVVVQFNPNHLVNKRPTTLTPAAICVLQPFDPSRFNFTKANVREALLRLEARVGESGAPVAAAAAAGGDDGELTVAWAACSGEPMPVAEAGDDTAVALVYANISPIFGRGGLLLPRFGRCLSQVLSPDVIGVALRVAALSLRPSFRLGFNSLGAWASVNHMHFQSTYCDDCFDTKRFPVEDCGRQLLLSGPLLAVEELTGWPLGGFRFSAATSGNASDAQPLLRALSSALGKVATFLCGSNTAHNLLIADAGRTVYLMPRQLQHGGGADAGVMAVAFAESCGLAIVYSQASFDGLTQAEYEKVLVADGRLPEDEMELIRDRVLEVVRETVVAAGSS